jgi:hypothetical protein
MCSGDVADAAEDLGYPKQAAVQRAIAVGYEAHDKRDLTSAMRTSVIEAREGLLQRLVGNAHRLPGTLYARKRTGTLEAVPQRVAGLLTPNVMVLMASSSARRWVQQRLGARFEQLCERAESSDRVEGQFLTLMEGTGYKPAPRTAADMLEKADFRAALCSKPSAASTWSRMRAGAPTPCTRCRAHRCRPGTMAARWTPTSAAREARTAKEASIKAEPRAKMVCDRAPYKNANKF